VIATATWPVLVALAAAPAGAEPPRPNIVLILADDLGYGEVGCFGQKLIKTPSLDRMAREGLRFTRFYAGSPVCAPSRSVLVTGQHAGRTRVRGNAGRGDRRRQELRPEDVTVAEVLRRAGYETALIGKWGLGHEGSPAVPTRKGFDHFVGYLSQTHAHNYWPEFLVRGEERLPLRNKLRRDGKPYEDEGAGMAETRVDYAPDVLTGEALRWVEAHRERPFFLLWSPIEPHANNEARGIAGNGNEVPGVAPYEKEPWKDADRAHAAMITRLDADVGRMLDLLEKLGIDGRTLVIFTSDNGHHAEGGHDPDLFDANGPLRGKKRDLYEGGIRVPTIAWWPGKIGAGTVSGHVAYFGDFLASAAELAGAAPPPGIDSVSFAPALLGKPEGERRPFLYWEFHEGGFSQAGLLDGRWKGIRNRRLDAPLEVYDLDADPGETTNVAGARPEIAARLDAHLRAARTDSPDWPIREAGRAPAKKDSGG
jgi:arylsulfatase A-like enzyme